MSDPLSDFEVDGDPVGPPCVPSCDDGDCLACAAAECPEGEPLHRDKDGCPACSLPWDVDPTWAE